MSAPAREIPAHETHVLAPKRHAHALVIPIINEGDRIAAQLERIAAANSRVDIVIADGGSNDGSTDHAKLAQRGVRALLVKTGAGRLSAQLRMGYAWCLDEGYSGIVTMDGNGKDGVDAIDRFVAALEEGYDLVQGSRYVRGGEAINTPLDRELGGRFIHAPLMSLAGGFRYTDTTNGFRGYSARLLNDPRVQPFRDVFRNYNLLFYLSVRAPQLKMRCCEIPVSRGYPERARAPTKIAGMRGRFAMLEEAFGAALGRWTPRA